MLFLFCKNIHPRQATKHAHGRQRWSFGAIAGDGRDSTCVVTRENHQTTTSRPRVGATATTEIRRGGGVFTTRRTRSTGGGTGRRKTSSRDLHLLRQNASSSSFSRALWNMTRRQQVHAAWFTPARLLALFCLMSMLIYVDRGAGGVRRPPPPKHPSQQPYTSRPILSRHDGVVSVHSRFPNPHSLLSELVCFVSLVAFFYPPRLHRRTKPCTRNPKP